MASADSSLPAMMVSPRGDEARNVARRYLASGLHLADKLHHRRRDTKGRDLMRHPQEGSRSVGVVHDEELLAVTSATSIVLIPHTAMLSRRWLTSGDLSSTPTVRRGATCRSGWDPDPRLGPTTTPQHTLGNRRSLQRWPGGSFVLDAFIRRLSAIAAL